MIPPTAEEGVLAAKKLFTPDFFREGINIQDFKKDDIIIKEGDLSNETMYFIIGGEFAVFKLRAGNLEEVNQLKSGDFFGEMALISNQVRSATVIVKSETAKLLLLSKKKFTEQARVNPALMFSILKATIARMLRAEGSMDRCFKKLGSVKTDILIKLHQKGLHSTSNKLIAFLETLQSATFHKGQAVFNEGDEFNGKMYFIIAGNLVEQKSFNGKPVELRQLEAGDFFGEMSMISGRPRMQSVVVLSENCIMAEVDKSAFMKCFSISPDFLLTTLRFFIWQLINTERATTYLKEMVKSNQSADIRVYKEGEIIIREGDDSNETMYFILNGTFSVQKDRPHGREEVNILRTGDFFGELSLISNEPRTATILVKSETAKLIHLSKKKFIDQTRANPGLMTSILKATIARLLRAEQSMDKILKRAPDLESELQTKMHISRAENINVFNYVHSLYNPILLKGEKVFDDGDASNGSIYFLITGTLVILKKYQNKLVKLTSLEPGDFFGESALISNVHRNYTVVVSSQKAKVALMDKNIFTKIVKMHPEFLFSLLRTVIWKLIIAERSINKLNLKVELYEKNI